ncbi:Mitochondrial outer membrane protein (Sam35), putative [Penicillium digitatum]|uniref:Mitochondrial outer membrane protein (Sam35), putative n=3 Tax=Penicillium digitatum TaxID=36651 RepID=K9FDI0_PEND2|nr:Mitochondrial outer membrane protein (Sam35), putative [Penicillium digitatum Pd1]EKV06237.1 Mitochondrial outer membrane protein (Sam35), putative [Penicillium digitatum PHI26]EKV18671.1 Mitochondrial outer membrane protein (Sam35), putative [Penicillium digitatum Pd1]QQK47260.1 Mitochondrial outer membrane protein (Sam35), putative [Penicillium digitatum]
MPPNDADGPPEESSPSPFFTIPAPLKRLFDKFPLTNYPANEIPQRFRPHDNVNQLYVFADASGVRHGRPSFNPQCLKWQAYLKFVGIDFEITSSNNHASPNGSLPFLLPSLPADSSNPIPSHKIQKWAIEQVHCEEEQQLNLRFEVYASLLDNRIRSAWLYMLYLDSENFDAVARRLYVNPTTSNSLVRAALCHQLQQAARDELLKTSRYIDAAALEGDASSAFEALSTLLGKDQHFFGRSTPGLFDASVFAYTQLILDDTLGWKRNRLGQLLKEHPNLVQHRDRLLKFF